MDKTKERADTPRYTYAYGQEIKRKERKTKLKWNQSGSEYEYGNKRAGWS
jgi:hypothetical protein